MQIVIDIEEGRYNWIMSHASNDPRDYANTTDIVFRKAVESGAVLPKGHGRLIDADAVIKKMEEQAETRKDKISMWETATVQLSLDRYAPTIIEADNSESEK